MARQKAVAFVMRGYAVFDAKTLGSTTEAEKKVLAAKDAAAKSGVTITDFQTSHTSVADE